MKRSSSTEPRRKKKVERCGSRVRPLATRNSNVKQVEEIRSPTMISPRKIFRVGFPVLDLQRVGSPGRLFTRSATAGGTPRASPSCSPRVMTPRASGALKRTCPRPPSIHSNYDIIPHVRGSESAEARRRLLVDRISRTAKETTNYSMALNPKAGSVFVEIHRQLSLLPFWKPQSQSAVKSEIGAAKALHGQLPSIDLLLDDRYVSDRIIENWMRHNGISKKRRSTDSQINSETSLTLINSYSGTKCLTLKAAMIKCLRKGLKNPWSVTPETFILNSKMSGVDERRDLHRTFKDIKFNEPQLKNIWILKPSHRNKGIGIRVFDSYTDIVSFIDNPNEVDKNTQYVAQKYIERPFLIHRRKFDLRAWCVVTPQYDIYVYNKGVMRTASEAFQVDNLDDELSHLTNHCIQETGPNFGKYEIGNEMWYDQFQSYLDDLPEGKPGHGISLKKDILPQVNKIIKDTLLCAKPSVIQSACVGSDGAGSFQLFGFDFMLDDDMRAWLIEINGSPASAEYLLEGMMKDLIEVIVEPVFPPPAGSEYTHNEQNGFMCVYKNHLSSLSMFRAPVRSPACSPKSRMAMREQPEAVRLSSGGRPVRSAPSLRFPTATARYGGLERLTRC